MELIKVGDGVKDAFYIDMPAQSLVDAELRADRTLRAVAKVQEKILL